MSLLVRTLAPIAVIAAGGLLLGACSSDADTDGDETVETVVEIETVPTASELSGSTYELSEITGHTLVPDSTIELVFDDSNLSVHAGCNRLFGGFSIDDGVLTTPQMASTMMACDQALMDQDGWMIGLLEAGPAIRTGEDVLTLTDPAQTVTLTFALTDH